MHSKFSLQPNSTRKATSAKRSTTAATKTAATNSKRFVTCSSSTPFKSFLTTGLQASRSSATGAQTNDFAYDLSPDEMRHMARQQFAPPMKEVLAGERELLESGQRAAYLLRRNDRSPNRKYNYPQATSWRIGWLQAAQSQSQPTKPSSQQQQ